MRVSWFITSPSWFLKCEDLFFHICLVQNCLSHCITSNNFWNCLWSIWVVKLLFIHPCIQVLHLSPPWFQVGNDENSHGDEGDEVGRLLWAELKKCPWSEQGCGRGSRWLGGGGSGYSGNLKQQINHQHATGGGDKNSNKEHNGEKSCTEKASWIRRRKHWTTHGDQNFLPSTSHIQGYTSSTFNPSWVVVHMHIHRDMMPWYCDKSFSEMCLVHYLFIYLNGRPTLTRPWRPLQLPAAPGLKYAPFFYSNSQIGSPL